MTNMNSLKAAAVAAALFAGMNMGLAAEADWTACESAATPDAQIAACTKIVNNQNEAKDARADAFYFRGNAYGDKRDFDKAIADYNRAIELVEYAVFYASRGWAYTEKGDLVRAIQDCDKAIALNPNLALGYTNRGAANERKGDIAKAIADYKSALAVKTDLEEELVGQEEAKQALARLQSKMSSESLTNRDGDIG